MTTIQYVTELGQTAINTPCLH